MFDNSTGGASSAFGTNNIVRIDGIQAVKIPETAPLLIHPEDNYTAATTVENITQNGEPVLTEKVIGNNYYFNTGSAFNSSTSSETYETFSYTSAFNRDEASSYAYRGTLYLPEHYVTAATQENQTELRISATLLSQSEANGSYVERATLKYTIELGDTQDQGDQTNEADKVRQLPRGRYYDIIARITTAGDELEMTAAVKDWTLQEVSAELNGPYSLQVAETSIKELIAGGTSATIACSTDAPILTYESPTYKDIPIYSVEFQRDETTQEYTSFTVSINPKMPALPDGTLNLAEYGYIYIIANNLRKRIDIQSLSLAPYLVVSPASYTVYMKEVSNLNSYPVVFYFSTNLEKIQINHNEEAGHNHIKYQVSSGNSEDLTDLTTDEISVVNGQGALVCTLNKPYEQTEYPSNETIKFTYEYQLLSIIQWQWRKWTGIPNRRYAYSIRMEKSYNRNGL